MKTNDSILSSLHIAKPCSADWESMTGDERVRACQLCALNVYNISDMSKNEAEAFLRERIPQGRVCVRFFRRADGTIITENCPRELRAARDAVKRMSHEVAVFVSIALSAFAIVPAFARDPIKSDPSARLMGKVAAHSEPQSVPVAGLPTAGAVAAPDLGFVAPPAANASPPVESKEPSAPQSKESLNFSWLAYFGVSELWRLIRESFKRKDPVQGWSRQPVRRMARCSVIKRLRGKN